MKLDKILNSKSIDDELDNYLYLEQNVNNGSPSGYTYVNEVAKQYNPRYVNKFIAKVTKYKIEELNVFESIYKNDIMDIVVDTRGLVDFYMHPEVFKNYSDEVGEINDVYVYPTASSRTVLVKGKKPFFAKLHYNGLLGRVDRAMNKKRVEGGMLMSDDLMYLTNSGIISDKIAFLSEGFGVVKEVGGKEVGISYRGYRPNPIINEKRFMIPFFSLFSMDRLEGGDTLLKQLCARHSDPRSFFMNEVIYLLIVSFSSLVEDGGLWPENHAQNILLEIDVDGMPKRIVHRDLYEMYTDVQVKRLKKLIKKDVWKVFDSESNYDFCLKQKSYLFDFKFGEYVLDPLIKNFANSFDYDIEKLYSDVKKIAYKNFIDIENTFHNNKKWYSVPISDKFYKNGMPIFIENLNPKFR